MNLVKMHEEKAALEESIRSLELFSISAAYRKLDIEQQKLIRKQLGHMLGYLNTLTQRLILLEG